MPEDGLPYMAAAAVQVCAMDEINALYDLIETFGHNNAGELTAEGAKAKAFCR